MSVLSEPQPMENPSSRKRAHVLVIEDSRTFSSLLCHRFEKEHGLRATHCASTRAFREAVARADQPFDIAVVDLNLPDSPDGQVLDEVAALGIPAVVFTADFNRRMRERVVERGVADYVIKNNERAVDMVVQTVDRILANRHVRVLLVDDVTSARKMLVDMLQVQQFQVFEATTGSEALDMLVKHPGIDLVITDYHMPDMDGYELTRRIRREHTSDKLRIIGISSSADRLLSASFLKAGANDFVYRPFVVEELQCRIGHNIETLTQLRQLRLAAFSDYLTGLRNRRHFFDEGPARVASCLEHGEACSMAMLDIDHFKKLNDTYGHEIGDRVLKAVATRLSHMIEDTDHLLARLGGEEFGILLAGLDSEAASRFCEQVRQSIAELHVALDDTDLTVTASIGVAEVGGIENFSNYLNAADQFLYLAKRYGRNRVYSDNTLLTLAAAAS
ncbi:diguanylate cyclase [Rhizobium sp. S-51]|jgi:diguanylate cyclase (GGDEF)-like protein|uniref:diguanylate cyclase n=1 Tax=Rhizobium terricola TaxID=2728849 RepID=A0A7Y0ATL1_9HYPH|nr:diguanylate cyclase [Rhizobium terricola]NML73278.1 diguanylate cyclase [Rhizobium terricola]